MNTFIEQVTHSVSQIDATKLHTLRKLVTGASGNIIILGNGGSNAIASHIAEDYTKVLKKPTLCFSDAARLTCYANDYGYENSFVQYLKEFSQEGSLVILISSSGNSKNIINCASYCKNTLQKFILMTGFDYNNDIRKFSDKSELDIWVDSTDYGVVECTHEIILHSILTNNPSAYIGITGVLAGAFDLIHPGYCRMFKESRMQCDHLTVLLHEDPSIERNKIKPIHSVNERIEILQSIRWIDSIVPYRTEKELTDLLCFGKFDKRFLGEDYCGKEFTANECPIEIVYIKRDHDYSTTSLKDKLRI